MRNTSRKIRWTVLLIAAWTLSQTIVHISFIIYGYLMSTCRLTPKYCDLIYIYRTYFYRESCGSINVTKEFLFIENDQNILYDFVNETVHHAVIKQGRSTTNRTEMYLIVFFFIDVAFAAASIFLAVWAFNKTKQKYLSMIFCGPWLLCCGLSNFMDVVSSVHYGLDLIYIRSYTSWLKFIGASNYQDFAAFNGHQTSPILSTVPTIVMVSVLSRAFVVWILNIICFFVVFFISLPDVWRATAAPRAKPQFDTGEELDLNSTEARIRNWQLFYGAIEANSTMTSESGASASGTDHNSNTEAVRFVSAAAYDNVNPFHKRVTINDFSAGSPLQVVDANNANMPILKGHLPWSYVVPEEVCDRRYMSNMNVRMNPRVDEQAFASTEKVPPQVFHLES